MVKIKRDITIKDANTVELNLNLSVREIYDSLSESEIDWLIDRFSFDGSIDNPSDDIDDIYRDLDYSDKSRLVDLLNNDGFTGFTPLRKKVPREFYRYSTHPLDDEFENAVTKLYYSRLLLTKKQEDFIINFAKDI